MDCDICTGNRKALVPHRNAPLTETGRLREAARGRPDARPVERVGRSHAVHAVHAVRAEPDALGTARLGPWLPWTGTPRARALALAQPAAGRLPLTVRGVRRRSGGWTLAGALLLAHGALGLTYDFMRPRD